MVVLVYRETMKDHIGSPVARLRPVLAALLLAGCGPDAITTIGETTAGSTDATSSGDPSSSTSSDPSAASDPDTSTDPGTTTVDPTTDPSTTTDPTSDTDCEFVCTTTDTGCGLVETPDGLQPRCSPCDVWYQDCPDGDKCVPWDSDGDLAWDSTRCVTVEGDGVDGDPCVAEGQTGVDNCAFGHVCWSVDPDTGEGTCLAQCTGDADEPICAPGKLCMIVNDGAVNLCLTACEPLEDSCLEGQTCQAAPSGDGFVCLPKINTPGGVGSPCDQLASCDPGLLCLGHDFFPHPACEDAGGCCAPYCNLSQGEGPANPTCAPIAGDIPEIGCVAYYEEGQAPPGFEDLGVCIVP